MWVPIAYVLFALAKANHGRQRIFVAGNYGTHAISTTFVACEESA